MCSNFDTLLLNCESSSEYHHESNSNTKITDKPYVIIGFLLVLFKVIQRHLTSSKYIYLTVSETPFTGEFPGRVVASGCPDISFILSRIHTNTMQEISRLKAMGMALQIFTNLNQGWRNNAGIS